MTTLRNFLGTIRVVSYPSGGTPVEGEVTEALVRDLAPKAKVIKTTGRGGRWEPATLHVSIGSETGAAQRPGEWMSFQIGPDGGARLTASHARWLYPMFCMMRDEWLDQESTNFLPGKTITPTFPWLRNLSDFFVGSLRTARHFDRENYVQQLARMGFSHVSINGLGVPRPFESSPPGDVYSWFYDYSPDLDQFVDSRLLRGDYPADYLQANLNFLKRNAALVLRYGLTPGLHINSPRSMPEEFWHRYGFLRGARVDHPRETVRPRYVLAMAHPVVQQHYRELIRRIMAEIPEIGFIHLWTNDSGAGFEFVTSLYAGRNGGPYLIREWKKDEEIARSAAGNVLTYFRLLRDEARKVNPGFRLICDLGPFFVEKQYIIPELGQGIDAGEFAYFESPEYVSEREQLAAVGAHTHVKLDLSDNNVVGIPYPSLVYQRLKQARTNGALMLLVGANPNSLAPFDINAEVVRSVQLAPEKPLSAILEQKALAWAGASHSSILVELWGMCDDAVRAYPTGIPYSTFAFPWFRLWVRPFVPNIDAIQESERAYYEKFLLATFNNPARVDLNNDMMWNFLTVREAAGKKSQIDSKVLPQMAKAIDRCESSIGDFSPSANERQVFRDLHDRLIALRCFFTTMRNSLAWIEAIHGYLEAQTPDEKDRYRALCREMVTNEVENSKILNRLWKTSEVNFMPVSDIGETLHMYGENFGDLLSRKIDLMERHADDEPYIDPDYMWRMPD